MTDQPVMAHNATMDPAGGRAPTDLERDQIIMIKSSFAATLAMIEAHCQDGREKALAITHLEDSCMRATRAVFG